MTKNRTTTYIGILCQDYFTAKASMSKGVVCLLAALAFFCLMTPAQANDIEELNPSRMARASPLRWDKRDVTDSLSIVDEAEKRAPLRWGKRMSEILSELQKRTLLRWGKRGPER